VTKSLGLESRFYYQPIARIYMRGYALSIFIDCLYLTRGAGIAVALRLLIGVAAFSFLFCFWYLGGRGLGADRDGIRFRRWFRWHFIPWSGVSAFSIKQPEALSPTVYVDLVSGESRVMPFTQGRKTRWKSGSSRDTVAVLNAELEQAQKRGAVPALTG
jgi:hypothetical protein